MNNDTRNTGRLVAGVVVLVLFLAMLQFARTSFSNQETPYTLETFEQDLSKGRVDKVEIVPNSETPTGSANITLKDGTVKVLYATDITKVEKTVREDGISPVVRDVPRESWFMTSILPVLLVAVICFFFFYIMNAQAMGGGANAKMMDFGKSRAVRASSKDRVTFADVAGLKEEKEDLQEIVDFLKDPGKYTKLGARIPKGVLLEGPPGTGKTLLAKAVAGEAGVPFFSISGSDFVEMFVGVGASRVRDMFEEAKKNAPCIVFIDEIDAVARRRGTGLGGGHDEREQTLNQLLVEMDGFGNNEGVIVMAATNRADILDNALLRPGRFDRQIYVGLPDIRGREAILKVHARGKKLDGTVNLNSIAKGTPGFSGADLENLLNEAAIQAVRSGHRFIMQEDIDEAIMKVSMGPEKKSKKMSDRARRLTAYHEAGHAVAGKFLPHTDPVHYITIIPRGPAGGFTLFRPQEDLENFKSRTEMYESIVMSLGGRVSERLFLDDISTGASGDIQQATNVARDMVMRYGMSDRLGPILYDTSDHSIFIGRDFGTTKSYSEETAAAIDEEVKRIFDQATADCEKILTEHKKELRDIAEYLLANETMEGDEFDYYFEHGTFMPPELKEVKNDSTIERPARHISMDFGTPAGEEKPEFSSPSDTDKQLPEQTEEPAAESSPDRGQAETAKTSPDQSPTDADAKSDSENSELPK